MKNHVRWAQHGVRLLCIESYKSLLDRTFSP
jgi:hypothetical protein